MKAVAAFCAVNLFFVALNVLGAGILFGLFRLGQVLVPGLMNEPSVVLPLGILGVATTIWCAYKAMHLMGRRVQGRGPGRG